MGWFEDNAPKASSSAGGDWFAKNAPKPQAAPAAADDFDPWQAAKDFLKGAVVNTTKGVYETGKRVLAGPQDSGDQVAAMVMGPLGPLVKDIAQSHVETAKRGASEALQAGQALRGGKTQEARDRMSTSVGYGVATAVPMLGPVAAHLGEKIGTPGQTAEGLGEAAGMFVLPEVVRRGVPSKVGPVIKNQNPVEAAAMEWAAGKNPDMVNLGMASGNKAVQTGQKLVEYSPAGAWIAERGKARQAQAFQDVGGELAGRSNQSMTGRPGPPRTPEQAGQGVRDALQTRSKAFNTAAEDAYSDFRKAELNPKNKRQVRTGYKEGPDGAEIPIYDVLPLPVDMTMIRAALVPLNEHMKTWIQPAQRSASAGLQAVKSIVEGPDWLQASDAEIGLSSLKELAREGNTRSAGMAKMIIPQLQKQIDSTVATAGKGALDSLREGRKMTAERVRVDDVLGEIREEPVQAFEQAKWAKDAGIERLRRIHAEVPDDLPNIGRAYLDQLMGEATAEGGFSKTQGIHRKWESLGPETKKLLFPEGALRSELDNFFLVAKRLADNPNPSGTGPTMAMAGQIGGLAVDPMAAIGAMAGMGALAKLMYSPAAVKLLTQSMTVPAKTLKGMTIAAELAAMAGVSPAEAQKPKGKTLDQITGLPAGLP